MPPAVDYMLGFDGVHILDQRNVLIDPSVQQIADLTRPHIKKSRGGLYIGLAVLFVTLIGIGVIVSGILGGDEDPQTTLDTASSDTEVAINDTNTPGPDPTDTSEPTQTPTDQPSDTPQPTQTPTPIPPTLSATEVEQTIQAEMNALVLANSQTEQAQETATAEQDRQYARGTAAALTLTATQWTPTPTVDTRATAEARLTGTATQQTAVAAFQATAEGQQTATRAAQLTATQQVIDSTATADAWTDTPTPTPTPTIIPNATATLLAFEPQTNANWTPIERDFDGVTMVLVPAGCFDMGSNDGVEDEHPVHEVCFDEPFWIDKYEVTNEQYGSTGCSSFSSAPDEPRNCVDWFNARTFCQVRGAEFDLPTEAQWEYTARGPDSLVYPWGNDFVADNVVYSSNSGYRTAPIVSRPNGSSWVGAMDMSGNVWEWTSTIYNQDNFPYPYDETDGRENDSDISSHRVIRGGAFNTPFNIVRAAYRSGRAVDFDPFVMGFRCVRPVAAGD